MLQECWLENICNGLYWQLCNLVKMCQCCCEFKNELGLFNSIPAEFELNDFDQAEFELNDFQ